MPLEKLETLIDTFDEFPDPADRTDMLLSYADQFKEVPPEIATRPFPEKNQIPQCESDAYVWALSSRRDDEAALRGREPIGHLRAGARHDPRQDPLGPPAAEIATVNCDIVERIFRRNISMGKGMGLMAMVDAVRALAKKAATAELFLCAS